MRTIVLACSLIGCLALFVSGCGGGEETGDPITAPDGPGDFAADYKTSSDFFTLMAAPVAGMSPHGTTQIWYSSNIRDVTKASSFTVPEGTTAIKEFDMDKDGTLDGIAVMIKKAANYDTANNDWYYDMRDLMGAVQADPPAGKTPMCIMCHAGYKATDYLGGTLLR